MTDCCSPEYRLEARESLRRWTLRSDHFCIHKASRSDGSILVSIRVKMGEDVFFFKLNVIYMRLNELRLLLDNLLKERVENNR